MNHNSINNNSITFPLNQLLYEFNTLDEIDDKCLFKNSFLNDFINKVILSLL
jgi:hypothetical protein